jgi:hypothetical protein
MAVILTGVGGHIWRVTVTEAALIFRRFIVRNLISFPRDPSEMSLNVNFTKPFRVLNYNSTC